MKHNLTLTIASGLSILLLTFHLTDDIVLGIEKGGLSNLMAVPILVLWLYATLVLAGRRSGYLIILLGSLLGSGIPIIHFMAKGGVVGSVIAPQGMGMGAGAGHPGAGSSGAFFFVWTLIALGVTTVFSILLAARGVWSSRLVNSVTVRYAESHGEEAEPVIPPLLDE